MASPAAPAPAPAQGAAQEGVTAPLENAPTMEQAQESPYGPRFEDLPMELQNDLRAIKDNYRLSAITARRGEIKRVKQARKFWKGEQNVWFDEETQGWFSGLGLGGVSVGDSDEDFEPRYAYVTNIYQAYGLSIIAALSAQVPSTRFLPQSLSQIQDKSTARSASDIAELLERNNKAAKLFRRMAYLAWTDGKIGTYTRFVVDGQRFGYQEYPVYGMEPRSIPETEPGGLGERSSAQAITETEVPFVEKTERIPKGQEVIDVVGALELHTPVGTNDQKDFPFLFYTVDMNATKLRAAYPHVDKKIRGLSGASGSSGETEYERQARLEVAFGTRSQGRYERSDMVEYQRCWLRPHTFYYVEDEERRAKLLELFPNGVYVAFAGDVYCEARAESMDDHWAVDHAYPGDGQDRPAVGTSVISPQQRTNTIHNLIVETIEFGISMFMVDTNMLDWDFLKNRTAAPGNFVPVKPESGQDIKSAVYQTTPARLPSNTYEYMGQLEGQTSQLLTGAAPALFGASQTNIDTASGYAMARDQALGRLGLVFSSLKALWGETVLNGVKCFLANRDEDVEIPQMGAGGDYDAKVISMADLGGSVMVERDTNEQFPQLFTQVRQIIFQMLENPVFQSLFSSPKNLELLKQAVGIHDLEIPGEDSRTKQQVEITQLLQEPPRFGEMGETISSMPVDPYLDNHQIEAQTVKEWMNSMEGIQAKNENPEGHVNVRAHGMEHEFLWRQAEMVAAIPPVPPVEEEPEEPGDTSKKG